MKTGRGDVSLEGVDTLDVSCGMGAIVVDRVGGDATLSSGSGRVRLGELSGSAVVKNSHGDIRVGTAGGDLRASTAKGDVTVESALADVTAATSYGDVRIGEVVRGATSLKTARGEIEIGIRSGTTALLDARSIRPGAQRPRGRRRSRVRRRDAPAQCAHKLRQHRDSACAGGACELTVANRNISDSRTF
nr:DUF4097 family beta strand repeat-containing protein [Rhodococcus tukisamuensis]